VVAADYPFLDLMWTMFVFFLVIGWFCVLFHVFADIFRRHDIGGWAKAGWLAFTVVFPFLGVFVYLVSQTPGMTQRDLERAKRRVRA
jgi:predicted membrane channel-forming protein YqfA (hemolysin III family)